MFKLEAGRMLNYGFFRLMRGTVGFIAEEIETGKKGIVTAGHIAKVGVPVYYRFLFGLGKATRSIQVGDVDCAFVPFVSGFTPSNNAVGKWGSGLVKIGGIKECAVGDSVVKFGAASGRTSGTVKKIDGTVAINGKTLTDMVYYSNVSKGGDSGGPFGVIENGMFMISGLHVANNSNTGLGAGCKIQNILSALDVKLLL